MARKEWISGGTLQKNVIDLGHQMGFRFAHFRSVQTVKPGGARIWETPIGADGKGWPDLFFCHPTTPGEVYFREIKGQYETIRPEQERWGEWLLGAGCDWAIWRPSQWDDEIVRLLTFGKGKT